MMGLSSGTWRLWKCHNQIIFSAENNFRQSGRVNRHLHWKNTNPLALFVGNDTLQVSVIRYAPKNISGPSYCFVPNMLQEFAMPTLEEEIR